MAPRAIRPARYYANQNATWAKGEMVPMLYDWEAIRRGASSHQTLSRA